MKNYKLFKNVISNCILAIVVVAVVAVSFVGGVLPASTTLKPTSRGDSETNVGIMVVITEQGNEYIESMLNLFAQNGVTVTFFVSGTWATTHEDTLKKIHAKGHEIGNQGYYNLNHSSLPKQRTAEEISITHKLIKDILGVEMTLFYPPLGLYSEKTLSAAIAEGYKTVMPTNDTKDLVDKDKTLIHKRAIKNLAGGTLILMHPTLETIDALGDIIHSVLAADYKIATITDALGAEMV